MAGQASGLNSIISRGAVGHLDTLLIDHRTTVCKVGDLEIPQNLSGVHLKGVYLIGVCLMGVYLMGVYLMGVHLIDVYFMDVYIPESPPYKQWCGGRFVEA